MSVDQFCNMIMSLCLRVRLSEHKSDCVSVQNIPAVSTWRNMRLAWSFIDHLPFDGLGSSITRGLICLRDALRVPYGGPFRQTILSSMIPNQFLSTTSKEFGDSLTEMTQATTNTAEGSVRNGRWLIVQIALQENHDW